MTGPEDNGGVHTNSGVFAHIFYMLSNGESGTNDNGNDYTVEAIGNDKSGQIMYRAMNRYLTQNSNYHAARSAMINAASDLYGSDSNEKL